MTGNLFCEEFSRTESPSFTGCFWWVLPSCAAPFWFCQPRRVCREFSPPDASVRSSLQPCFSIGRDKGLPRQKTSAARGERRRLRRSSDAPGTPERWSGSRCFRLPRRSLHHLGRHSTRKPASTPWLRRCRRRAISTRTRNDAQPRSRACLSALFTSAHPMFARLPARPS